MEEQHKLPNNIRQIGERDQQPRIYLEDYVDTFIRKRRDEDKTQAGILLGHSETIGQIPCRFINGAILVEELVDEEGLIQFTPEVWNGIRKQISDYFPNSGICGWFVQGNENHNTDLAVLKQIHRSTFSETDSLLFVVQGEEQNFYNSSVDGIERVAGYYIYYERNECMQNYMVALASQKTERGLSDNAIHNFRSIMNEHNEKKRKYNIRMIQKVSAGTAVAAAFLGICITMGWAGIQLQSNNADDLSLTPIEKNTQQVAATVSNREKSGEDINPVLSSDVLSELLGEKEELESSNLEQGTEEPSNIAEEEQEEMANALENEEAQEAGASLIGSGSYVVLPGDTLVQISLNFYGNVDRINDICEYNGIDDPDEIYVGQKLIMP